MFALWGEFPYNFIGVKLVFTKHALKDKLSELERFGWRITKTKVKNIIKKPRWRGVSRHGEETAMDLVDDKHILRVIFNREDDIIKIITFHIARRGKYESTL